MGERGVIGQLGTDLESIRYRVSVGLVVVISFTFVQLNIDFHKLAVLAEL